MEYYLAIVEVIIHRLIRVFYFIGKLSPLVHRFDSQLVVSLYMLIQTRMLYSELANNLCEHLNQRIDECVANLFPEAQLCVLLLFYDESDLELH